MIDLKSNIRITIRKDTKDRLAKFGHINSSWDSVLNDVLNHLDHCDVFWSDRT